MTVLVTVSNTQDSEGVVIEELSEKQVYCNLRHMGATEWEACRQAGLHADGQIQVWSCDYEGQQRAIVGGVHYDIERMLDLGDFTYLTLARRNGGQ